jgi:hypothetical protein
MLIITNKEAAIGMKKRKAILFIGLGGVLLIFFFLLFAQRDINYNKNETSNNITNDTKQKVEAVVRTELPDFDQGEYSISDIQALGEYIFVLVDRQPNMGQNDIVVYAIKEEQGKLSIVEQNTGEQPGSLGVAVYRMKLPEITVVYGSVGNQVWLNPDEPVTKVDFTEVKVLYAGTQERSIPVENFQAFMFCLEGDIYIDDVVFLSKGEIVNRLSLLPIGEDNIQEFNK